MDRQLLNAEAFARKIDARAEDYYPTSCHWEVTSHCNAACAYCYVRDNHSSDLSTHDAHTIIDKIDRHGAISLNLSGGEPFLRDDIHEILAHLFRSNIFWFVIMSNGLRVKPHHIELLSRFAGRIGLFQISFFSHIPAVNDAYLQIPGALHAQMATGSLLMEAGIKVAAAINVLDFNVHDLPATMQFFAEKGYAVEVAHEKIVCRGEQRLVDPHLTSSRYYLEYLRSLDAGCRNQLYVTPGQVNDELLNAAPCAAMKSLVCIDGRGDVFPCPVLRHVKIGNILGDCSLREILVESAEYRQFRSITYNHFSKCRTCSNHGCCRICVGKNYLETGDLLTPAPQTCDFAKSLDEYFRHG